MQQLKFLAAVALASAAMAGLSAGPAQAAEPYAVDQSHAQITFKIDHLGYSTMQGQFEEVDGSAMVDWENPANSAVDITIQAASIDTNWPKRDAHLRGKDFFNVEAYPTIHFKSAKIDVTGDNTADITGDLTLLGVTKPVVLKTVLNKRAPRGGKDAFGISATARIKRSDYGMSTYAPSLGDEVQLDIEAEFTK